MSNQVAVMVDSVNKQYIGAKGQQVEALSNVSFKVTPGEFVSLLGPSGCGKTTCLRILAGLSGWDSGEVLVEGARVNGPGDERAMVFQTFNLFPWMTVKRNVEFGLRTRGVIREEYESRAAAYLDLVGLGEFSEAFPHELSGGMQQRVGIARALCVEPRILLMDEPFGAVDAQTRELLQAELLRILASTSRTVSVVFVTHSIDEAVYLSDRIVVFSRRPGHVKAEIPVTIQYPRRHEVRSSPVFGDCRDQAWEALRDEIVA